MNIRLSLCVVLLVAVSFSWAAITKDLVDYTNIKQYLPPDFDPKSTTMYSGYLQISPSKYYHYIFVTSEDNKDTDPVVVWLQGGPGCSGLFSWMGEVGPFMIRDGDKVNQIQMNPNRWSIQNNLLFLESPIGVGFTYSTNDADYQNSDNQTALDNQAALAVFFQGFPEFRKNDFYITGESYAGMYIPYLANQILINNTQQPLDFQINLKGIAVGNGCTDWRFDDIFPIMDLLYERAIYQDDIRAEWEQNCKSHSVVTPTCNTTLNKVRTLLERINIYDIYGQCYTNDDGKLGDIPPGLECYTVRRGFEALGIKVPKSGKKAVGCIDSEPFLLFWNNSDIRTAFHVTQSLVNQSWDVCSDDKRFTYDVDSRGSIWAYPILMKAGVRILKYSGDADACVPTVGTLRWIRAFQEEHGVLTKSPWQPWYYPGNNPDEEQVGGFIEEFDDGFTFLSIRGAGHMAPRWRSNATARALLSFLANENIVDRNTQRAVLKNSRKATTKVLKINPRKSEL